MFYRYAQSERWRCEKVGDSVFMRVPSSSRPIDHIRLDGGRACLDFVNTLHDRFADVAEDYIAAPERFLEWGVRAIVLGQHEAKTLLQSQELGPGTMRQVVAFREQLHGLFSAIIDGRTIPADAITALNQWVHLAWQDLTVDPSAARWVRWNGHSTDSRLPLKRIALSALEFLSTFDSTRLRRCGAPNACGWLFYDETKNGRRRWCSMDVCGTLNKMSRYRRSSRERARAAME